MSRKSDPWVRLFDVNDSRLHEKGYTVYKIISTVFPKNCPEAATEVIVWKRFRDIKKLHKNLQSLHSGLHLKGDFPEFPKEKIFGRFDPLVIEERRQSTLSLLQFVARYSPLFTSQIFVKFFEDNREASAVRVGEVLSSEESPPLCPVKCDNSKMVTDLLTLVTTGRDDVSATLSGASRNSQLGDEDSPNSDTEIEDLGIPKDPKNLAEDDSSNMSTSSTILSLFDPLMPSSKTEDDNLVSFDKKESDDIWLQAALATCGQPQAADMLLHDPFEFPKAFEDYEGTDENTCLQQGARSLTIASGECGQEEQPDQQSTPVNSQEVVPQTFDLLLNDVTDIGPSHGGSSNVLASISKFNSESFSDYLLEAARLLQMAQESESNGSFEEAFDHYKTVIGTLLSGVQDDLDAARRSSVRRKITQYLQHAEDIYQKRLCNQPPDDNLNASHPIAPNKRGSDCKCSVPMAPAGSLGRYKVLGLLGKVLLTLDVYTNMTHIIKVLSKTSAPSHSLTPYIVPPHLRHMVQLVRFHETDDSIFLVLQHAVGGRLWTYVASYLNGDGSRDGIPPLQDQDSLGDTASTYVGKQLLSESQLPCQPAESLTLTLTKSEPGNARASSTTSSADCSPSYVDVFSDYLASVPAQDRVFLAECQFATYDKNISRDGGDNLVTKEPILGEPPDFVSATDPYLCYNSWKNHVEAEHPFWDGLENVDPKDLISNARRLMKNVEETIIESKKVEQNLQDSDLIGSADVTIQHSKSCGVPQKSSVAPRSRTHSGGCRRHFPRQTSEDPFAASSLDLHLGRRQSSGGSSLELQRNRMRHFSAVFKELDDANVESPRLPESCIKVWAAEIVATVSALHSVGIICRDLKPDNILLGERGHVLLSYFSQWPCVDATVDPVAKKWLYVAPEVGGIYNVTPACDWWSVGALLFELLTGKTLVSLYPGGLTSHTHLLFPSSLSAEATSLLQRLLCYHPSERLGSGPNGDEHVKAHPFFRTVNWKELT